MLLVADPILGTDWAQGDGKREVDARREKRISEVRQSVQKRWSKVEQEVGTARRRWGLIILWSTFAFLIACVLPLFMMEYKLMERLIGWD